MVSTRSFTIPPASSADNSPASDVPAGQSIMLQPLQTSFAAPPAAPPAREEHLLNQQLNVGQQPDINLTALLIQQSQLLQQMQQSLAILSGNIQSAQAPVASETPPAPPAQASAAPQFTEDPCKRIKLEIPKFDGKNAEAWIINFERYCKI